MAARKPNHNQTMSHHISNLIDRIIQPTGSAPCAGCGAVVETVTVLGRTVYACDACAKPQVFACGEKKEEGGHE